MFVYFWFPASEVWSSHCFLPCSSLLRTHMCTRAGLHDPPPGVRAVPRVAAGHQRQHRPQAGGLPVSELPYHRSHECLPCMRPLNPTLKPCRSFVTTLTFPLPRSLCSSSPPVLTTLSATLLCLRVLSVQGSAGRHCQLWPPVNHLEGHACYWAGKRAGRGQAGRRVGRCSCFFTLCPPPCCGSSSVREG